jgi:hypothetical protein
VDDREAGEERVLALEYVRSAIELGQMTEWNFLARYGGEISRAARYLPGSADENGRAIVGLLQCHGRSVSAVLEAGLHQHAQDVSRLRLPLHCLLRLVFGPDASPPALETPPGPESARPASTGPPKARPSASGPSTITAIAIDATHSRVLVEGLQPLRGPRTCALLAKLARQYREDQASGMRRENHRFIKPDKLAESLGVEDATLRRQVSRIRAELSGMFLEKYEMPLSQQALIQNRPGRGYRLNPGVQVVDPSQLSE